MTLLSRIPVYDFFHPGIGDYIARRGGQAACWVERYRQSGAADVEARSSRTLLLLRSRRIEEAQHELRRLEGVLPSLFALESSIGCIAARWFYSVDAYLHYLGKEFSEAERQLDRAADAVSNAISREEFLLPFAHHCADFRLQKARLARDRQRWIAMRDHLDEVRGMNEGTTPLCVLADGHKVYFPQIIDYYSALDLSEKDYEILRSMLDTELRLFMTTRAIRMFYMRLGPVTMH